MGTTLTALDFTLNRIHQFEKRIMHHHLSDLKHPQWGSIVGYEADVRLAVLKDELKIWEERVGNDSDLSILKDRIEEVQKDAVLLRQDK
jgi:hypothetical protein